MNDGSAQRSPLASYRMAKTDDDSEQSEKALMMENTVKVVDTRPEMPSHNSKDDSDRVGKPKDDGVPSGLSNNAKVDMARALLGGGGGEEDFDMSMVPMAFPQRLHDMLSNEENSDVISWLPHGKGFIIRKKEEFSNDVLPKYFKEAKFTSFTRKLNRWGFTRVTRGTESGAYYHPYFQQGNLRRTLLMTCHQRSNSGKKKTKSNATAEDSSSPHLAGAYLGAGPALAHISEMDQVLQEAATRRLLQLDQRNPALLSAQQENQIAEQFRAELLLRQEQQQLAKLEDLRNSQTQQFNNSEAVLQALLAQVGASSGSNSLSQQQRLLAQLGASSSLGNPLSGSASTASSASYPAVASAPAGALESAIAATLGSPLRGSLAGAGLAGSGEPPLGSNHQSSLQNSASGFQRNDPTSYHSLMLAQQKAQTQANSLGQMLNQEEAKAQQSLMLQAQQQKLNELLQQQRPYSQAQPNNSREQEHARLQQSLPPKKR